MARKRLHQREYRALATDANTLMPQPVWSSACQCELSAISIRREYNKRRRCKLQEVTVSKLASPVDEIDNSVYHHNIADDANQNEFDGIDDAELVLTAIAIFLIARERSLQMPSPRLASAQSASLKSWRRGYLRA